jgi:hypothetical protein
MTNLEIITIAEQKMFSRANMAKFEETIVFELQNCLDRAVRAVKREPKENQRVAADKQVTWLVETFGPKLNNKEIEAPIRELARFYYQN